MKQPLIVGVHHAPEDDDCLLDKVCQKRFEEEVSPLIDWNTLLLLEGAYYKEYRRKLHLSYLHEWFGARRFIGAPIGYPTIGFRDARFRGVAHGDFVKFLDALLCYFECMIVFPPKAPKTFAELLDAFLHNNLKYKACDDTHKKVLHATCSTVLELNRLFDEPMIAAAREWEKRGKQAIIVCGSVHATTIHRATKWPVKFLMEENEKNLLLLNRTLIALVLYPEKVLKRTPPASR